MGKGKEEFGSNAGWIALEIYKKQIPVNHKNSRGFAFCILKILGGCGTCVHEWAK
jgi:hypothetical protein